MIQYYQLTPDILLEYVYEDDPKLNEDGAKGNEKDIYNNAQTILLKSDIFSSKYLCFKKFKEKTKKIDRIDDLSNLALPLNNTETEFVVAKSKYQNFYNKVNTSNIFLSEEGNKYIYEDTNYDKDIKESCDVKYDKCIVHFTSRNYFGDYDSLIFQAYGYLNNKAKIYFASFIFRKTSNVYMEPEQLLYNGRLYTTQIEFDIPSAYAFFVKDNINFNNALKQQNVNLLKNTPIGINLYGVKGSIIKTDNYERLKTFKINTISIPYIYNRFDEIYINISEAPDGDYYYIDPEMRSKTMNFVDYIESMGDDIRSYVIMHELCLKESWVDENSTHSEITHKEHHIIDIKEYDEDNVIIKKIDAKIKYRPICVCGGKNYKATIIDTIKIINTVDSSTYEISGSLDIANPNKYGKKIRSLDIKRPIVNVYNKNVSSNNSNTLTNADSNDVIVLNKSGGFIIENMTQNITSFIECTNVGVSVVEISPSENNIDI